MKIKIMPQSVAEEVGQNIAMIIGTLKGSVVTDREFGINSEMIDKPMPIAKALLEAEIIAAIQKYEPRALVTKIEYLPDADTMGGELRPKVHFEVLNA